MTKMMARKDITQKSSPRMEETASGAVEKAMTPSSAYTSSLKNDHLVLPAERWTFSVSNHFVL